MAEDPKKLHPEPSPIASSTLATVRIVFCVLGVVAILIGLAMVREDRTLYNRYGTPVPSRATGTVLIAGGIVAIVTVFRRDLGQRKP